MKASVPEYSIRSIEQMWHSSALFAGVLLLPTPYVASFTTFEVASFGVDPFIFRLHFALADEVRGWSHVEWSIMASPYHHARCVVKAGLAAI